ncbi:MAG: hypothetical protein IT582_00785 [Opitutaceae bacterium]|nr:hypothetical protein [Opitutaceae bacterium]
MGADDSQSLDDAGWLARGQSFEASGTAAALTEAVACYDRAIALLQSALPQNAAIYRRLAIAWMNRGNALQKQIGGALDAARAYDRALALFDLVKPADNAVLNSMGAAWLNRGHALAQLSGHDYQLEAIASTDQAVGLLGRLPVNENLDYRLNLAGAQTNLAHQLIAHDAPDRWQKASAAVAAALALTATHEQQRAGFADLGLKARRALCQIIGQWLIETDDPPRHAQLIASASDAVDTGMALGRHWETLGVPHFHPLIERLFRFGTAFYRRHQVHFLADFVLENLDPTLTSDAFAQNPALVAIARTALEDARGDLRTQFPVIGDDAETTRRLQILQTLEEAAARLGVSTASSAAG